jgi:hypothetical protein
LPGMRCCREAAEVLYLAAERVLRPVVAETLYLAATRFLCLVVAGALCLAAATILCLAAGETLCRAAADSGNDASRRSGTSFERALDATSILRVLKCVSGFPRISTCSV